MFKNVCNLIKVNKECSHLQDIRKNVEDICRVLVGQGMDVQNFHKDVTRVRKYMYYCT